MGRETEEASRTLKDQRIRTPRRKRNEEVGGPFMELERGFPTNKHGHTLYTTGPAHRG